MNWTSVKSRRWILGALLGLIALPLAVMAFSRVASAAFAHGAHSRSRHMPYFKGKPFVISIDREDYTKDTKIKFAVVKDKMGNPIQYWRPYPCGQEAHPNPTGKTKYSVTVIFDTLNYSRTKPVTLETTGSSLPTPQAPAKSLPAPEDDSPGLGSILCICTDANDDCPMDPATDIPLDPMSQAVWPSPAP